MQQIPIGLVPASKFHTDAANIHMYTLIHKYVYANMHVYSQQIRSPMNLVPASQLHEIADADETYTYI